MRYRMQHPFVYMDYNATTPLHPEVKKAMMDDLDVFANASSMHEAGRRARDRVETARAAVARLIGAPDPLSIYFTSGGSESNNTVFETARILGPKAGRKRIITTAIEHPCVIEAGKRLEGEGFEVLWLGVDPAGRIDMSHLAEELDPAGRGREVFLVSVMLANNEIGTIEDVAGVVRLAKQVGARVHTDATQAVGKIPVDVLALG
ncbi:MAG: aminotransferase class V-fold PLP-dependent enzyme, partial [Treponema sp.]|nr:aminotransferase class V-fold PLP-dependent enzyme [Treponema sp.]